MNQEAASERNEEQQGRFSSSLFDWSESIMFSLILVVVIFTFLFRMIAVDGRSMEPTLLDHDMMIVSNLGYTPDRGDVVVVNKQSSKYGPLVKRIIAVGGDTVDINFATGDVMVNGEVLDEPYIKEPTYTAEGTAFPLTVPEGQLFLMGTTATAPATAETHRLVWSMNSMSSGMCWVWYSHFTHLEEFSK